jgi:hypothetical protein
MGDVRSPKRLDRDAHARPEPSHATTPLGVGAFLAGKPVKTKAVRRTGRSASQLSGTSFSIGRLPGLFERP